MVKLIVVMLIIVIKRYQKSKDDDNNINNDNDVGDDNDDNCYGCDVADDADYTGDRVNDNAINDIVKMLITTILHIHPWQQVLLIFLNFLSGVVTIKLQLTLLNKTFHKDLKNRRSAMFLTLSSEITEQVSLTIGRCLKNRILL